MIATGRGGIDIKIILPVFTDGQNYNTHLRLFNDGPGRVSGPAG